MSEPTRSPDEEADAALARLAGYGAKDGAKNGVKNSRKDGGGAWARLILLLVMLLPLAAVAWVAWQQAELRNELAALRADNAALQQISASSTNQFAQVQQRQQELDARVQQTQALEQELVASRAALAAQAEQLTALRGELTPLRNELAALRNELAALRSDAAATRQRVNALDANAGGAPLTEAESLLRLAQQRLVLARDSAATIELFQAADEVLRVIEDPAVFAVRETLAREVAALQALPVIDVPGIFARLGAQSERVNGFAAVAESAVQDFTLQPTTADAPEAGGWWEEIKQTLGEYFVVTRSGADVQPQLDAAEQFQLRALVQLQIEQARLALLRAEPELYRRALDAAISTSQRWLRDSDGSIDDFVATLEGLRDTAIVADFPAMDQTLTALRRLTGASTNLQ